MTSEKFSLKWNDFEANVSKSFNKLRREEDFFDVTLISDDELKLSAHKVVLSSCSSFFKSILRITSTSNPVIYLSGVNSQNLGFMLDYMYQGEVQIFQEQLDDFLTVAQKFKIQGLISDMKNEEVSQRSEYIHDEQVVIPQRKAKTNYIKVKDEEEVNPVGSDENQPESNRQISNLNGSLYVQDINELDKTVDGLFESENGFFKCKVCGKTNSKKQNMQKHVEIHIEGLSFDCDLCNKTFRSRESLCNHKSRCSN